MVWTLMVLHAPWNGNVGGERCQRNAGKQRSHIVSAHQDARGRGKITTNYLSCRELP